MVVRKEGRGCAIIKAVKAPASDTGFNMDSYPVLKSLFEEQALLWTGVKKREGESDSSNERGEVLLGKVQ